MTKYLTTYDDATHELSALDPKNATGIGLPAFTTGTALPAAGQVVGEGFMNTATRTGYIWDGTRWQPIVPSALLNYPTDAAVLADTSQSPGSYATSQATGNLFICAAGNVWHQIGVRSYAQESSMRVDLNALEGDLAWSQDTNQLWYYNSGKWWSVGTRFYADEHTLLADGANNMSGAIAVAQDTGVMFTMDAASGNWFPLSIVQFLDEATMRMKTADNVVGQIAIASNKIFVWSGTAWVGDPLSYYASEVNLWNFDAPIGVLAIAGDTMTAYVKTAAGAGSANWKRLAGPNMSVGIALPTSGMATGDLFYNLTTKTLYIRGATTWDAVSGGATVSATAPTTPNPGQLWYDTQDLKMWDGTAWVQTHKQFHRISDGAFKIESTGATAGLEFYNPGAAKNFGVRSRTNPTNGPEFWVQDGGNFMEVAADGRVTFPHTALPRLAGKKAINHHMYVTGVWETSNHNISALTTWIPFGNIFKLEIVASGVSFHGGDFEIRSSIAGWGQTTSCHRELNDGDNTSSKSLYHAVSGTSGAGITPQIAIQSFSNQSNADRQVSGYILLWDLGAPANIPDLT